MPSAPKQLAHFKHFYHLVLVTALFAALCVPTAGKTVDIFGIPQSATVIFFPIIYIVSDLITEVYGYALARRALWYSIGARVLTMIVFQISVMLPASNTMPHADAFYQVLRQAPSLVLVGLFSIFVGDIVNNFVLAKMKIKSNGKNMAIRFIVSTLAGEFINTLIFYFFALAMMGIIPIGLALISTFLATFIKTFVEVILLPLSMRLAIKLKKIEGIDTYDTNTNFNPLKF